jgi:hypothetical protein
MWTVCPGSSGLVDAYIEPVLLAIHGGVHSCWRILILLSYSWPTQHACYTWELETDYVVSSCEILDIVLMHLTWLVMSSAGGATPGHRFWVQPFGDGRSRFIQPVRLAAWSQANMLIHCQLFSLSLFNWLIHVLTLWYVNCNKIVISYAPVKVIKVVCILSMQRLGSFSFFKKM